MKQIFVFIFDVVNYVLQHNLKTCVGAMSTEDNSKSQWLIYVVVYAGIIILIPLAFSWV